VCGRGHEIFLYIRTHLEAKKSHYTSVRICRSLDRDSDPGTPIYESVAIFILTLRLEGRWGGGWEDKKKERQVKEIRKENWMGRK